MRLCKESHARYGEAETVSRHFGINSKINTPRANRRRRHRLRRRCYHAGCGETETVSKQFENDLELTHGQIGSDVIIIVVVVVDAGHVYIIASREFLNIQVSRLKTISKWFRIGSRVDLPLVAGAGAGARAPV